MSAPNDVNPYIGLSAAQLDASKAALKAQLKQLGVVERSVKKAAAEAEALKDANRNHVDLVNGTVEALMAHIVGRRKRLKVQPANAEDMEDMEDMEEAAIDLTAPSESSDDDGSDGCPQQEDDGDRPSDDDDVDEVMGAADAGVDAGPDKGDVADAALGHAMRDYVELPEETTKERREGAMRAVIELAMAAATATVAFAVDVGSDWESRQALMVAGAIKCAEVDAETDPGPPAPEGETPEQEVVRLEEVVTDREQKKEELRDVCRTIQRALKEHQPLQCQQWIEQLDDDMAQHYSRLVSDAGDGDEDEGDDAEMSGDDDEDDDEDVSKADSDLAFLDDSVRNVVRAPAWQRILDLVKRYEPRATTLVQAPGGVRGFVEKLDALCRAGDADEVRRFLDSRTQVTKTQQVARRLMKKIACIVKSEEALQDAQDEDHA